MSRILFDGRALFDSGIGVYSREVLRRLREHSSVDVIVSGGDEEKFKSLGIDDLNVILVDFGRLSIKNQSFIDSIIGNYTIFFAPTYLLYANRKKLVVTIHDICPLDCRKFFGAKVFFAFWAVILHQVIFSVRIITISEFSKDRINKWFGFFSKKKISVIYNGVRELSITSADFSDLEKKLSIDREQFVLTVGNVKPHKNFRALVEFWKNSNTDIPLVIVGEKDNFRTKDKFEISNKNVVYTGRVSDEELSLLYSKAKFFVYPSLYEGFGLPLLEAMQSNLPIAASDIPVFKELASGRISYFSPSDFTGLKSFVDSKSKNDKEFVDYSDILEHFSWDKCVNELIEVFEFESSACK